MGFVYIWWDDAGAITDAVMLISTTGITPEERAHLIREELTQSLGLLNDSSQYEDSIFHDRVDHHQPLRPHRPGPHRDAVPARAGVPGMTRGRRPGVLRDRSGPTAAGRAGCRQGGPGGGRTHNLRVKSPLLCRLSYRPRQEGSRASGGNGGRPAALALHPGVVAPSATWPHRWRSGGWRTCAAG